MVNEDLDEIMELTEGKYTKEELAQMLSKDPESNDEEEFTEIVGIGEENG